MTMQKNIIKTAQSKNINLIADAVPTINKIHKKLGGVEVITRHEWRFNNE